MTTEYAYNGWPAIVRPAPGQLVPLVVRGETFPPGVLAGDVHELFLDLVTWLDAEIEPVDLGHPADDWGWHYRPNRNDARWLSTHAPATAIDYNATRHPNGVRGTWTKAQAAKIRARLRDRYAGVIQWGEDYVGGVVDGMHFEIIRGREQVARVAAKIRAERAATPPLPTGDDDTMIVASELKGPGKGATFGILSGGILTGLADPGGADKAAAAGRLHVQWVTPDDWGVLDAKSKQLLAR